MGEIDIDDTLNRVRASMLLGAPFLLASNGGREGVAKIKSDQELQDLARTVIVTALDQVVRRTLALPGLVAKAAAAEKFAVDEIVDIFSVNENFGSF